MTSPSESSSPPGSPPTAPPAKPRLLTFWSIGWVLILALLVSVYSAWWTIAQRRPSIGDGRTLASYHFNLSNCLVPQDQIIPAGLAKDGLRAMTNPRMLSPAEYDDENKKAHGTLLVPDDLVIGVTLGGEPRVYPLMILTLHEIANDTIGAGPEARHVGITYNPLCDSVVVFDRTVAGRGGTPLEFGVSGLVYNSNLVMFDRHADPAAESLWSQLEWRAIAGPAAGPPKPATLRLLPFQLMRWADWRRLHPDTTVLARDPDLRDEYPRNRYGTYFRSDEVKFPVEPAWDATTLPNKTHVAAVKSHAGWRVYVLPTLHDLPADRLAAALSMDNPTFTLHFDPAGETLNAVPAAPDATPQVVDCFLFAWYAHHPQDTHLVPPPH